MKPFIKYPVDAFLFTTSHAERTILLNLLKMHFQFCGLDYHKEFYITDRDLSEITGCSTRTVWKTKNTLSSSGLISFKVGPDNKTHYKMICLNGKPPQ